MILNQKTRSILQSFSIEKKTTTSLIKVEKKFKSTSNRRKGGRKFFHPRWRKLDQMVYNYEEGFMDKEKNVSAHLSIVKQMMQFHHPLGDIPKAIVLYENETDRFRKRYYEHFPLEDPSHQKRVMPDEDSFYKSAVERFVTRQKTLMKNGMSEEDAFQACLEEKLWCDDAVLLESRFLEVQANVFRSKLDPNDPDFKKSLSNKDEEKIDMEPNLLTVEEDVTSFLARVFLERVVEDLIEARGDDEEFDKIRMKDIFTVVDVEHVVNFVADFPEVAEYFDEDIFYSYPKGTYETLMKGGDTTEELIVKVDKARRMEIEVNQEFEEWVGMIFDNYRRLYTPTYEDMKLTDVFKKISEETRGQLDNVKLQKAPREGLVNEISDIYKKHMENFAPPDDNYSGIFN